MPTKYIIDTHTHIGYWPTLSQTENNLVLSQKNHNINFSLVSFDDSEYRDETEYKLTKQVEGTKKALFFAKKYKNFGVLIWIRPHKENNWQDIEKLIIDNKDLIYGLKFHPACSKLKITNKKVTPYLKLAQKYDLPILVHTAMDQYSSIVYLEEVAKLYPKIKFIAAHMELYSTNQFTVKTMIKNPNIYCDTAWVKPRILKYLVKHNLMDRIMFGSDSPIDGQNTLDNIIYQKYFTNFAKLNNDDFAKIMYKNAMSVYKIKEENLQK